MAVPAYYAERLILEKDEPESPHLSKWGMNGSFFFGAVSRGTQTGLTAAGLSAIIGTSVLKKRE
jgi:hypothetical protein